MQQNRYLQLIWLALISGFLLLIAYWALSGAIRQIPQANALAQQAETVIQLGLAFLSILNVATTFRWRAWAKPIRTAWAIFLTATAGLSALVWGPPMPLIALLFTLLAILVAKTTIWALRRVEQSLKI